MSSESASVWDEIGQEVFLGRNESGPFNSVVEANTTGKVAIPNPESPVKTKQKATKGYSSSTDETGGKSGGGNPNLKQTATGTGGGGDGGAHPSGTLALSSNNSSSKKDTGAVIAAVKGDDKIETLGLEQVESFDAMGLKDELLRGVKAHGFEMPTLIQQRAIHPIIFGKDVIAQAPAGAGKTAAYALGVLQSINTELQPCQAMILAPTRESVVNIAKVISSIGQCMDVRVHAFVGGASVRDDVKILRECVHIAVGTPGRVQDLIQRRALVLDHIKLFILDEADELLSRSFEDQVRKIIKILPRSRQCAAFSAIMPAEVVSFIKQIVDDQNSIFIKQDELPLEAICRQFYVGIDKDEHKLERLCDLYKYLTITAAIVYCSTHRRVEWLTQRLKDRNFSVSCIHGDMAPLERDRIMKEFKSAGSSSVLITTDVILPMDHDIPRVSLVINYDLPIDKKNFIHRINRLFQSRLRFGRLGRKGMSISFVLDSDMRYMQDIEHFYKSQIEEFPAEIYELI